MYVCLCRAVTDGEVRDAIHSGCTELGALQDQLGVAVKCGSCKESVRELLLKEAKPSSAGLASSVEISA